MTALQTFPATSTSTTEIDHSHYGRSSAEYEQQRFFQTMEQGHEGQNAASATETIIAETKDYSTVGSTLNHLERTGQVSASTERPDVVEQVRSAEEDPQTTVLDRRKEGHVQSSQEIASNVDDGKTLPRVFPVAFLRFLS